MSKDRPTLGDVRGRYSRYGDTAKVGTCVADNQLLMDWVRELRVTGTLAREALDDWMALNGATASVNDLAEYMDRWLTVRQRRVDRMLDGPPS